MFVWSLTVAVVLVVLYWLYRSLWRPYQALELIGVKGPRPNLLFGNGLELYRMGLVKYFEFLNEEYGSISGFYLGPTPWLVVSDLDILKQVLVKEFDSFADRHEVPDVLRRNADSPEGLLQARGAEWRSSRHTLSPTFSAAKMKSMVPLIENSATGLIKIINNIAQSEKSANLFKVFGSFTMETIVATAFGRVVDIQGGENDQITTAADLIFRGAEEGSSTSGVILIPLLNRFPFLMPLLRFVMSRSKRGAALETLQDTALALIEERRRQTARQRKYKDLLQLMMDSSVEGDSGPTKLSNEQILAHSVTFLLAGYETTANTLTYTAYLLALHPALQEKLQGEIDSYMEDNPDTGLYEASQEISYLDMVLLESLRMYSPAQLFTRECLQETTVNGLTVPQGAVIVVPVGVLHKDPQYWEEPHQFKPERFTAEEKAKRPQLCYLPFGHGPRSCIGMRFALLEAKIALIEILRKYSFVRAPDTEVPLETVVGITMAPKNGVFLKVVARK